MDRVPTHHRATMSIDAGRRASELFRHVAAHEWRIARVVAAMTERFDEDWTLSSLAELSGISRYYFIRVFCQITGLSPFQYLAALRLHAATRLILTTGTLVTDACLCVGYSSPATFTHRFIERFGLSPQQMRKTIHRLREFPIEQLVETPLDRRSWSIGGVVHSAGLLGGLVLVGVFRGQFSQSRPVLTTILPGPGAFSLPALSDGRYSVFVQIVPPGTSLRELVTAEHVWVARAAAGQAQVRGGAPVTLELRPRISGATDPPIRLGMARLMARAVSNAETRVSA